METAIYGTLILLLFAFLRFLPVYEQWGVTLLLWHICKIVWETSTIRKTDTTSSWLCYCYSTNTLYVLCCRRPTGSNQPPMCKTCLTGQCYCSSVRRALSSETANTSGYVFSHYQRPVLECDFELHHLRYMDKSSQQSHSVMCPYHVLVMSDLLTSQRSPTRSWQ